MRKRILALALAVLLCAPLLGGCEADAGYQKFSTSFFDTFDTLITLIGFAKDQATFERAASETRALFTRLHKLYDNYQPYAGVNNLYALNRGAMDAPMQVEPELFDLLAYCKEKQPLLYGTVNVAMGAVLSIWHDYREDGMYDPASAALPPMDRLLAAAEHTDFDDVILDETARTVYYADPKLRLDLGAVAKGYAAQLAGDMLLASDMPSFILSAGGNIVAGEPPKDGRLRWGVTVQDPDGALFATDGSDILDVLYFTNLSAVTSGDYQRYYVVDDVKYHHIISPDTLMPADFFRAVTVVYPDSGMADLLSTALFLMPQADGLELLARFPGAEAMWVLPDRTVLMSEGMKTFARSQGATSK